jgi:hypothetical protein
MAKQFYAVAKGRVPGIYKTWSLAKAQVESFSCEKYAGFDELELSVDFMVVNGDHSEENIKVFGQRGGQYTLREWVRRQGAADQDSTTPVLDGDGTVVIGRTDPTQAQGNDSRDASGHSLNDLFDGTINIGDTVSHVDIAHNKLTSMETAMTLINTVISLQKSLKRDNENLKSLVKDMGSKMDSHYRSCNERELNCSKLVEALEKKDNECRELTATVTELRTQTATLTADLNQAKWVSFRNKDKSSNSQTMLIGSSMIRDIDETKLLNTKVQCIPGAHLAELKETVRTLSNDKPCDRLVIVGGGNDCSDNTDTTALVNSFKDLIETAKSKANTVTVASICPRGDQTTQDRVDLVNAGIQGLCADLACTYCDTTDVLKLADGSMNEGFFMDDLVHLTYKGQNKIAQKLDLKPLQTDSSYNVVTSRRQKKMQTKDSDVTHVTHDRISSYRNTPKRHRTHDTDRPQSRSVARPCARCTFCAEPHHETDRCRHQRPVTCYTCGSTGHKSKYCESLSDSNNLY